MSDRVPVGRLVAVATVVGAGMMLLFGAWMRVDPDGFARWANWPSHVHFLHDAGVFQLAIGVMMLCALWWRDAPAVVLAGFVFGNTFHAINHAQDAHLGGSPSDPWALGVVSVLAAAGLYARLRSLRGRKIGTEAGK
ncbi:hypothetical protein [Amycolatopsis nigrescens]|uniref:hypothetical protein n=1 Tax=Amycolatopsis nigrescens TaxID=381445 RepID=UPI00036B8464|nr:hypothetical protein [Amycolatopsis nigrescens]